MFDKEETYTCFYYEKPELNLLNIVYPVARKLGKK